ncbi:hypothetical protein BH24ACT24_BH24ACT24_09600 [soil metagenome]
MSKWPIPLATLVSSLPTSYLLVENLGEGIISAYSEMSRG